MQLYFDQTEAFLAHLQARLDASHEATFWKEKVIPATSAIIHTLAQLDVQRLLFTPEGVPIEAQKGLNLHEFLVWFDLVSLKTLCFTLDASNTAHKLLRTRYDAQKCATYAPVDITMLAEHLRHYQINLHDEMLDFPNRFYIQHKELGEIVKRILS